MPDVVIDDKQKKFMLIRSLPESLSVIFTVSSAQTDMTVESLYALVRAEINRKSNLHNHQGKQLIDTKPSIVPRALMAQRRNNLNKYRSQINIERSGGIGKKKSVFYYSRKPGHFKKVCRRRIADEKKNGKNNNSWRNNFDKNNHSSYQNNENNQQVNMQGLVSALRTLLTQNQNSPNVSNQISYNGWMARGKFRSNVAEFSEEKKSMIKVFIKQKRRTISVRRTDLKRHNDGIKPILKHF